MIPVFAPSFIPFGGGDSEAETTAWVAAVIANGGSVSSGRRTIVNTLIASLKADGIWDKLDRLWLFAAENEPSALTDLVGLTLATAISTPTFTADEGYTGNGTSSYIDSNYNPTNDGVNYVLNSAHYGAWVVSVDAVITHMVAGANHSSNITQLYYYDATSWLANINQGATENLFSINFGSGPGMLLVTRTGATSDAIYGNGGSKDTTPANSTEIPNSDFFFLARSTSGSPSNYGAHQIAAAYTGGGMNDTDAANFYSSLSTYMTAVGL